MALFFVFMMQKYTKFESIANFSVLLAMAVCLITYLKVAEN